MLLKRIKLFKQYSVRLYVIVTFELDNSDMLCHFFNLATIILFILSSIAVLLNISILFVYILIVTCICTIHLFIRLIVFEYYVYIEVYTILKLDVSYITLWS